MFITITSTFLVGYSTQIGFKEEILPQLADLVALGLLVSVGVEGYWKYGDVVAAYVTAGGFIAVKGEYVLKN